MASSRCILIHQGVGSVRQSENTVHGASLNPHTLLTFSRALRDLQNADGRGHAAAKAAVSSRSIAPVETTEDANGTACAEAEERGEQSGKGKDTDEEEAVARSNLKNIELRYAVKRHDTKWSLLGASFCFYFHSLATLVFGYPLSSQSLHTFSTTHRPSIPYDSRFSPPARRSSIGFWWSFLGAGMGRRLTSMQDIIEIRPLSLCCSPSTPPSAETAHRVPPSDRCLPERGGRPTHHGTSLAPRSSGLGAADTVVSSISLSLSSFTNAKMLFSSVHTHTTFRQSPRQFLAARLIRVRSQAFLIQVVRFHVQGVKLAFSANWTNQFRSVHNNSAQYIDTKNSAGSATKTPAKPSRILHLDMTSLGLRRGVENCDTCDKPVSKLWRHIERILRLDKTWHGQFAFWNKHGFLIAMCQINPCSFLDDLQPRDEGRRMKRREVEKDFRRKRSEGSGKREVK
ncbi:hypothetical protein B0H13DRAFT_1853043 [Mycena leptocephala]|nr:hypothetical protein B0H13DRAFT_1853043 [Mycena leptocephala]